MGCGANVYEKKKEKEEDVQNESKVTWDPVNRRYFASSAGDGQPLSKREKIDSKRFEILNYSSTKFSKDPPAPDMDAIHHSKHIKKFWDHTFIGHRVDYTKLGQSADFSNDLEVLARAPMSELFPHDNWHNYVQDGCCIERPRIFNEWDLHAEIEDAAALHRIALREHVHKWQDDRKQEALRELAAEAYKEKFTHTKKENEEAACIPRPPKKRREKTPQAPAGAPPPLKPHLEHPESKKETLFLKQQNDFRAMVAAKQQQELETW